ncbi:MAG: ABC transporter permease subunit [Planctomycetia bacterium]|nr:ABC transporter permease subunit [Planctomycetia bacterium]
MAHQPNLKAVVIDRVAAKLIPAGGILIVACVLGILVFLFTVAVPLFIPARASAAASIASDWPCLGVDFVEGAPAPWWVTREGAWLPGADEKAERIALPGLAGAVPAAAVQVPTARATGILFTDGRFALVRVEKAPGGAIAGAVLDVLETAQGAGGRVAAARDSEGHARLAVLRDGKVSICGLAGLAGSADTAIPTPGIAAIALSSSGHTLAAALENGELQLWNVEDVSEPGLMPTLPAGPAPWAAVAFLLGDETLLAADSRGSVAGWMRVRHITITNSGGSAASVLGDSIPAGGSVVVPDRDHAKHVVRGGALTIGPGGHRFISSRSFPPLPAPAACIAVSGRNKSFAVADVLGGVSTYHATTGRRTLRIEASAPRPTSSLAFDAAGTGIAAWSDRLRTWSIRDPHPDVSASALLAPLWYESYAGPEFVWQSSSGTQDSEPKYSLWPLFAGTLKGTLYALLFSVPVAFAAAIYVARFAHPRLRSWAKPSIELMAGIPSVVVGMIAALWLAPVLERSLCTVLVGVVLLPPVFLGVVAGFARLPATAGGLRPGVELAGAALSLAVTLLLAFALDGPVERMLFRGDFRQWLFEALHVQYDIRNGFLVGVALGFAVIPVIFTIAEDAVANVPASMTSAAVALGATRWQTVRHVVLPAAASGLFAAVVLGLGRAAGETMIVVMAAGNTPILDPAPWNGMRTLSAAMAIEIPEAPVDGSLYRVLFLTGLLLFAFTAVLNTIAEIVGTRLRRKYGRI